MRKSVVPALILAALSMICLPVFAQTASGRGPSTPEERKRFLAIAHKVEEDPLNKSLYPDIKWALQWIEDIPDITVNICPPILGEEFLLSRYKYADELEGIVIMGNVAFMIEHSDKALDTTAGFTAGVESGLKAYKAILKAEPSAKSHALDDLLQKQSQGKLTEFIRESSKGCSEDQPTSLSK